MATGGPAHATARASRLRLMGPRIVRIEDVPAVEVKAQRHGSRRVGVHLRFLHQSEDEVFIHCRYDPGMTIERHGHASDHAIYVLAGSVTVGQELCGPGTLVVLDRGCVFGPLVAGSGGTEILEWYAGDPTPVPADPDGFADLLRRQGIVPVDASWRREAGPADPGAGGEDQSTFEPASTDRVTPET